MNMKCWLVFCTSYWDPNSWWGDLFVFLKLRHLSSPLGRWSFPGGIRSVATTWVTTTGSIWPVVRHRFLLTRWGWKRWAASDRRRRGSSGLWRPGSASLSRSDTENRCYRLIARKANSRTTVIALHLIAPPQSFKLKWVLTSIVTQFKN